MRDLTDWSYLWTNRERYALVRTKHSGFAIVDVQERAAVLIDDDDLHDEIVQRMVSAGAKVLERFPA